MSTRKIQTPGNHPKERIKHLDHGESWKSETDNSVFMRLHVSVLQSVLVKLADR
jgi:hypothetical protein